MSETMRRELPLGWRLVRLGEVCQIIAGQSPPSSTYRNTPEGLPFFQGKADFGLLHPVACVWCVEPTKVALPGDILISVRAPVGPTNVADVECCIGRGLAAIRCGEETDRTFVLSALRRFEIELAKKGSGSTFHAISRADLENLALPLPLLAEQQRIAAVLNERMAALEQARAAAQAQLDDAKALPAAYLRQVFPKPGQPLPESWRWVRLGDLGDSARGAAVQTGPFGAQLPSSEFTTSGVPILNIGNVQWGHLDYSRVDHVSAERACTLSRYRVMTGDLLFTRSGTVGRSAIVSPDANGWLISYHLLRVALDQQIAHPEFIAATIRGCPAVLAQVRLAAGRGATRDGVNTAILANLNIPLPPLVKQQRIAAELKDKMAEVEVLRSGLQAQLNEINALPAALLRQAFNGEL